MHAGQTAFVLISFHLHTNLGVMNLRITLQRPRNATSGRGLVRLKISVEEEAGRGAPDQPPSDAPALLCAVGPAGLFIGLGCCRLIGTATDSVIVPVTRNCKQHALNGHMP